MILLIVRRSLLYSENDKDLMDNETEHTAKEGELLEKTKGCKSYDTKELESI